MSTRCYSYCLTTMFMLVVLRLTIGWHFYMEGSKHAIDPRWSSEGFLRQAKGPLAPWYQSVLPAGDYGFDAKLHANLDAGQAVDEWSSEVTDAWKRLREQFRQAHSLTESQLAELEKIGQRRQSQFYGWLDENRPDLAEHIHQWQRLGRAKASPSAQDVPFEKKRIDEAQAKLAGQANGWLAHVRSIERALLTELDALLEPDQRRAAGSGGERTALTRVDQVMKYGILAIGGCLILGLFARLAALLGAAFLASIVLSQPPWLPNSAPTYPQLLEMLALLTLVTVPVGRWCGLDFFLQYLFRRPCCAAKGKGNESYS